MIAYVLLRIFLILLLVAANAFFAAAEFALVSVRDTRIQQFIDAGRIVQTGVPEEIFHQPSSAFVAGFMGADNVVDVV